MQFENLIDGLGPGCKNPMMYPEVRYFYCLGCDPKQPTYTNGDDILVCKSFLDKLWRDPAYDECGVMSSNACPGDNWDFDPYMCGDDLILPKTKFHNNVTLFINAFKPPGLDDKTFVEVDDIADPNAVCWNAPAFHNGAPRLASSGVTAAAVLIGLALRSLL